MADDNRVLHRATEREAIAVKGFNFAQEAEGARWRDLLREATGCDDECLLLFTDQRVLEIDRVGDLETIRRVDCYEFILFFDTKRLQDLDKLSRRLLYTNSSLVHKIKKR